ncbi:MAG: glycosyltransferase family 4 protein [Anaerolineales bacterium]
MNWLQALFTMDQWNDYLLILSQPEPSLQHPNVRQWVTPMRNRLAMRVWAQTFLPGALSKYDIVHFAKNLGVFGIPTRMVVTVYDLTPLIYPQLFPATDVWYWRTVQKRMLRDARRIVSISQTTADDLVRFYDIAPGHICVIYPSCARHFRPASPEHIARVRQQYGLASDYILHVGHIDRKKNLPILVQAFARLRLQTHFGGQLVLVGEVYPKSPEPLLHQLITDRGLEKHIVFTGAVPDEAMPAVYSGATLLAYPSQHEGFGLVALEAMACGTPVVATRAGALAEVVGEAALVLDAATVDGLAEALREVVGSSHLREQMRANGLKRAQHFHWHTSGAQTLQLYEEISAA